MATHQEVSEALLGAQLAILHDITKYATSGLGTRSTKVEELARAYRSLEGGQQPGGVTVRVEK